MNVLNKFNHLKENNQLEVKSAKSGLPNSIWETYSSFSNTHGGIILLGVAEREDKSLYSIGLTEVEVLNLQKIFWDIINNPKKVSSNLLSDKNVKVEQVDSSYILVIEIPMALYYQKPIYINNNLFDGTYRRNNDGDYHCSRTEIIAMLRDQEKAVDYRVLKGVPLREDIFNKGTIHSFREQLKFKKPNHIWNNLSEDEFLKTVGAVGFDENNILHPTLFGFLFFGNDYYITSYLPEYFLDYQEHLTLDPAIRYTDRFVSDNGEWSGNLFDFFNRVYAKISIDLPLPFELEKNSIYRKNETPIHEAIREALANCITNADFSFPRGIVIKRYIDRIIIENPGSLRISVEEAYKGGTSLPRNGNMLKCFNLLGIGERAGSEIPTIVKAFTEKNYPIPILTEEIGMDRTSLTLILKDKSREIGNDTINGTINLSGTASNVLDLIKNDLSITKDEIAQRLKKSARTISRAIDELKTAKLLIGKTSNKGGKWILK
ncbi:MAG: putative DNA binding domain-containing protein [Anaeroplasma bactoclasticum]|nr:putative DNA binding domain-containing protein [Anaeroplasma bactoclasticum]